jgi:transposase
MKKIQLYCGIDISNETIDICYQTDGQTFISDKLQNTVEGFKKLLKIIGAKHHFVMETTGVYHLPLCFFLHTKKVSYSVVPALQIKRYIQMNLERNKSDKKDAMYICKYGIDQNPKQYEMPDQMYFECKALNNGIEGLTQEITVFKNKIHALNKLNLKDKTVIKSFQKIVKELQLQLAELEIVLNEKLVEWQPELVKQVSSITGIGKRATAILIVSTQGFKYTENYKQLISFAGLSPKEFIPM